MSLDLLTQVRIYTEQMDAEAPSIDELLEEILVGATPAAERAPRSARPGWVTALAAAVAVFLVVGGVALAFRLLRSDAPVVDEPDPSPVETLNGLTIEDVPSFRATVTYGLEDHAMTSGIVEVSYQRPDVGLRLEYVVESLAWPGGDFYLPGDFLVWDGLQVVFDNAIEGFFVYQTTTEFTGLNNLGWMTSWVDQCASESIEVLPGAAVAGITTVHLRCATIDGVVELWIDSDTGVVLAATGLVTIGPRGAPEGVGTELNGGYTVTSIEYLDGPGFDPAIFQVSDSEIPVEAGVIDLPEVHVVVRNTNAAEVVAEGIVGSEVTEDSVRTTETWYVDDAKWREQVLDSQGVAFAGPSTPGSYTSQLGDQRISYVIDINAYGIDTLSAEPLNVISELGAGESLINDPNCSRVDDTTHLGRSAHEYLCDFEGGLSPGQEAAAQRPGWPDTFTYIIDEETNLVLHSIGPGWLLEVLSIDFDAPFDESLFTLEPPLGALNLYEDPRPSDLLGQPAPPVVGTLLDGSQYDDSDWAGNRVAMLFWASWCDACVDALETVQSASERPGNDVTFVTVLTFDEPQAGRDAVTFTGVALPVIDDSQGRIFDQWQVFDWPWLILIDSNGIVVEVRGGGLNDYIATNLEDVLIEAPW